MRICFFSGDITRNGGTERVVSMLANHLLVQNPDLMISIVSLEEENGTPFYEFNERIIHYNLNIPKGLAPLRKYVKVVQELRKLLRSLTVDIFIDVDTVLSIFTVPALMNTKVKHISWEHFTYDQDLGVPYRRWGRQIAGRFADAIVVLTANDQEQYIANGHIYRPIVHIYNPIMPKPARPRLTLLPREKMILSAGRLTYQKGFDLLLEVAEKVFQKHPDWRWVIAGEGEDRPLLEGMIQQKQLEQHVLLPGVISQMDDYYQRAALFVLTSRFEPFGLVLTEAKSFQLPCISFDVAAGPAEIIMDEVNGYLIPPFELDEMAEKISYLLDNPHVMEQMSLNALLDTEKFHLEKITTEWIELFMSLVSEVTYDY